MNDVLTAKELTVQQVLDTLDAMGQDEPHRMAFLFPDVPVELVEMSVGKRADDLVQYPASEVDKIVSAVKKVNPFFLKILDRLSGVNVTTDLTPSSQPSAT